MTTEAFPDNPPCEWPDCPERAHYQVSPSLRFAPHAAKLYCLDHLQEASKTWPYPIEAESYTTSEHCDFCNGPAPAWTLHADDVVAIYGTNEDRLDADWSVCEDCKPVIETLDPATVADWVIARHPEYVGAEVRLMLVTLYTTLFSTSRLPLERQP